MGEDPVQIDKTFRRCAAGSRGDCDHFFVMMQPLFRKVASRLALQYGSLSDLDDIVQEINMRIAGDTVNLATKLPSDPTVVPSYFAVLAANGARDWFRARGAQKRGRSVTVRMPDTETSTLSRGYFDSAADRTILVQQIAQTVPNGSREKSIFLLYYTRGYSAKEIAAIPAIGLSTKGVESLISRLNKQIQGKFGNPGEGRAAGKSSS